MLQKIVQNMIEFLTILLNDYLNMFGWALEIRTLSIQTIKNCGKILGFRNSDTLNTDNQKLRLNFAFPKFGHFKYRQSKIVPKFWVSEIRTLKYRQSNYSPP